MGGTLEGTGDWRYRESGWLGLVEWQGLGSPQVPQSCGAGVQGRVAWQLSAAQSHWVSFTCPHVSSCFHPIPQIPFGQSPTCTSWHC